VIYAKWFQGRATFFSEEVFTTLLALFNSSAVAEHGLSRDTRNILDFLVSDSPMFTKQIKAAADMEGRLMEPTYNRAMKPLCNYLLAVGFGEFDDSSFPSLGVGATQTLFEDLWNEAQTITQDEAHAALEKRWSSTNPFLKFAKKLHSSLDKESEDTYISSL